MTIQTALRNIRSAIYGRDVRSSIHDAIEICYNERLTGGYNPTNDVNRFYSGVALFSAYTTNRPFNSSFLLIAGGNETRCHQMAYDMNNIQNPMTRSKEGATWSNWTRL